MVATAVGWSCGSNIAVAVDLRTSCVGGGGLASDAEAPVARRSAWRTFRYEVADVNMPSPPRASFMSG